MRAVDLIHRKRGQGELSPEEIEWLINSYVDGNVPDYQVAAWLMAVFFNGLTAAELQSLTDAMMHSGEVWDWSNLAGRKVDKHSTGGVGDKVSLILAPWVASCGVVVPMVSGRGLGHTGGTLDKLESIPGFQVRLSKSRVRQLLKKHGVAMVGQTDSFVPADKKMYALRDVTATVESIPLIAASIMSKKLAEGCDGLVLDIKVGNGAFMKDKRSARKLAMTMIGIGRSMNRDVSAILSDMNQPTGWAIGNANEVREAIECLRGDWPQDLETITTELAVQMLILGKAAGTPTEAREKLKKALQQGLALDKFRQMIEAQDGDPRVIDDPRLLPTAPNKATIAAETDGYIQELDTESIGLAACWLGAGRKTQDDTIDPGVGLWLHAKIGDRIEKGQPLFSVRYRTKSDWEAVRNKLRGCVKLAEFSPKPPVILEKIKG